MTQGGVLDAALTYRAWGYSLCPVDMKRHKAPHNDALVATGHSERREDPHYCRDVGIWRDLQHVPPTDEQLRTWFHDRPQTGVALVTGQLSGVVVLDFDGEEGVQLLRASGLTPHTRTPSGGYHLHVQHPGWHVRTVASKNVRDGSLPPGLDIRGDGGLAMLPPSRSERGPYTALTPLDQPLRPEGLPEHFRRAAGLLCAPAPRQLSTLSSAASDIPPGDRWPSEDILIRALTRVQDGAGRNDSGYWLARALYNNGYSEGEITLLGERYLDHCGDTNTKGQREAYTRAHFAASVRQVLRRGRADPWGRRDGSGGQVRVKSGSGNPIWTLQDRWETLDEARKGRAAHLVALLWYEREPVEVVVQFFRLLGYDARVIARRAYTDAAAGQRGHLRDLQALLAS